MKFDQASPRYISLLMHLSKIPRNMLLQYDRGNIIEFVLHDLCQEGCLNLAKAAYLIDNHDFDCLKGVAGFDKKCAFNDDAWAVPEKFSMHMEQSDFNQKVKAFNKESGKLKHKPENTSFVHNIGKELAINKVRYCSLPTKHDNTAILIYQAPDDNEVNEHDILNGLSLLNLCPVF